MDIPSGGLTLIAGTQELGFSCKVYRGDPMRTSWMKAYPQNPPSNIMFMPAGATVLPWKIVEDFQSFVKKIQNFDPHFKNLYLSKKIGIKSSHWSCLKACFKGYDSVLQHFWSDQQLKHRKAMNERAPKNVQMTLKNEIKVSSTSSDFRLCASVEMCDLHISGNA